MSWEFDESNFLVMSIFAPYWIVNRLERDLYIKVGAIALFWYCLYTIVAASMVFLFYVYFNDKRGFCNRVLDFFP